MKLVIDIKVADLTRAVKFYTEVLGLSCRTQKEQWAAIMVGDAEIHLYVNSGTTGHVEFYTTNIDEAVSGLRARGVVFNSGAEKPEAIRVDDKNITEFPWGRTAFFRDSEGNELALVQDWEM